MEVNLEHGERIDDLMINGLKIIQNDGLYCFTSDSVIISNFARVKNKTVLDLGSGSGIISFLCAGKYGAKSVTGVEIQEPLFRMSVRSASLNGLEDKVSFVNMPMQQYTKTISKKFDVVISNPPYNVAGRGEPSGDPHLAVCRHEVAVTLSELAASAARAVKFGGRFYLIHQAERAVEVITALTDNRFAVKRMRFVEGREGLHPTLVMIEASMGGSAGVIIERNLTLYDRNGKETDELTEIYSRENR